MTAPPAPLPKPDGESIARRGLRAMAWGYVGTAGRIVIQFAAQLVMARLLGPEVFGVYAAAAIALGLAYFVADMGLGPALVQRRDVNDELIAFVFTWQAIAGLALTVALWALAKPIATALSQPASATVLQALSLACLLQALGATAVNLLRRELRFKPLQQAQLASFAIGYLVVGIGAAWAGAGVWSLVAAALTQAALQSAWVYRAVPHAVGVRPLHADGPAMWRFGLQALATNMLNWLLTMLDRMLVARYHPAATLGAYTVAYNAVHQPTGQLLGVLQSALFPATARSSSADAFSAGWLLGAQNVAALLVAPAFALLAALSEPVVQTLYGAAWRGASEVLAAISVAMIPVCLMGCVTPVLWGRGRVDLETRTQLLAVLLMAAGGWYAAQHSAQAVAWVVAAVFWLRAGLILGAAATLFGLPKLPLAWQWGPGLLLACVLGALVQLLRQATPLGTLAAPIQLLAVGLPATLAWLALLRAGWCWTPAGAAFLRQLAGAVPGKGATMLRLTGLR